MTEPDPTRLLERLADTVPDSPVPVSDVIAAGSRMRRRRRRLVVVGAVTVIAAIAVSVAVLPRSSPTTTPAPVSTPVTGNGPTLGLSAAGIYAWAEGLPAGPPARMAFVSGHLFVAGATRLDLGQGVGATLLGPVPGGWFATYSPRQDDQGNQVDTRYGVLAPDGSFRAFADLRRLRGDYGGSLLSPDGSEVAYDGQVVDVASGRSVATIPGGERALEAWTDQGIEYETIGSDPVSTLWDPDTGRTSSFASYDGFLAPDVLVRYGDSCSELVRLEDGSPTAPLRACALDGIAAAAPSGLLISRHGRVYDTSWKVLADLDAPVPPPSDGVSLFPDACCSFVWEDDDTFLVTVIDLAAEVRSTRSAPQVTVRCRVRPDVVTGVVCERTSDVEWQNGNPPVPLTPQ